MSQLQEAIKLAKLVVAGKQPPPGTTPKQVEQARELIEANKAISRILAR